MTPAQISAPSKPFTHGRRLILTAQIFGWSLHLAIFLSMWGHPREQVWLVVLCFVGAAGNIVLPIYVMPRIGYARSDTLRAFFNVAAHAPIGILCSWNFASWLFVPFLGALATTLPTPNALLRILLQLGGFVAIAMLTGAHWQDAVAFTGISLFLYFVTTGFLELVNNLLRERDRTLIELHDAQQLVIAQEKMAGIGQIAAGVAHEINNPMCFVTANIEALLDDLRTAPELPAALAEYRDDVLPETVDGIKRVNSIVDDLRRFARGEPEQFIAFDLAEEIAAAVRIARTQIKATQQLVVEVPPELPMTGMPRQLGQVVLNLIVNALQALRDQGQVSVNAALHDERIVLTVRDDGAGMTEEIRQRIFEPFFTTKERQGVGLGLALVHGIVESHGGVIEVESALGAGSTFRLVLPRARKPAAGAARTSRPAISDQSLRPAV